MQKLRKTYTAPQTDVYLWEPCGRLLAGSVPEVADELIEEETTETWAHSFDDLSDDDIYSIPND